MDKKQMKAANRLLRKMSALRATLKRNERDLLDAFVQGAYAEVEGHVFKMATQDAVRSGAKDARAHALKAAVTPAVTDRTADAAAHALSPAVTPKIADAAAGRAQFRVQFDPDKDAYDIRIF
jgi:hypothetical protein